MKQNNLLNRGLKTSDQEIELHFNKKENKL